MASEQEMLRSLPIRLGSPPAFCLRSPPADCMGSPPALIAAEEASMAEAVEAAEAELLAFLRHSTICSWHQRVKLSDEISCLYLWHLLPAVHNQAGEERRAC